MIKFETILKDTLLVAKMTGWRKVGTWDEVKPYSDDEDCRECDLCAQQPEHLKEFYDAYFAYERKNGWISVQDFYEKHYSESATSKPIKPLNREQCWRMVNRVDNLEKLAIAELWLRKANVTNEEFDDLMMALSHISRELHHEGR